jgi:hypothetical protein
MANYLTLIAKLVGRKIASVLLCLKTESRDAQPDGRVTPACMPGPGRAQGA